MPTRLFAARALALRGRISTWARMVTARAVIRFKARINGARGKRQLTALAARAEVCRGTKLERDDHQPALPAPPIGRKKGAIGTLIFRTLFRGVSRASRRLADSLAAGCAIDFAIDEACFIGGKKHVNRGELHRLTGSAEIAVFTEMHDLLVGLAARGL